MGSIDKMGKALLLTSLIGGVAVANQATAADTLEQALKESTTKLSLRLRYEDVDVSTVDDSVNALTLKTRLTYTTGSFYDVTGVLEMDNVTALMSVDYNDGVNDLSTPPIVDPEGTEVNQAYLSYKGLEGLDLRGGRQRILLDNQRFVGGVGWRQNEQTYDGFSGTYTGVEGLTVFLARISNVNRIWGNDSAAGDHTHDTNLFNVGYKISDIGTLSAYYYDIDNLDALGAANETMGVRFAGSKKTDGMSFGYEVEFADQSETGDAPEYSASYYHLGGSLTTNGLTFGLAQESLGSDDGAKGFTTGLATLHKFQGWADVFLITPTEGVVDTYFTFKAGLPGGIGLLVMYHQFEAEDDNGLATSDLGSEIDLALTKKFKNGASLQLKYADFSGEEGSSKAADVTKLWLTAAAAF